MTYELATSTSGIKILLVTDDNGRLSSIVGSTLAPKLARIQKEKTDYNTQVEAKNDAFDEQIAAAQNLLDQFTELNH